MRREMDDYLEITRKRRGEEHVSGRWSKASDLAGSKQTSRIRYTNTRSVPNLGKDFF